MVLNGLECHRHACWKVRVSACERSNSCVYACLCHCLAMCLSELIIKGNDAHFTVFQLFNLVCHPVCHESRPGAIVNILSRICELFLSRNWPQEIKINEPLPTEQIPGVSFCTAVHTRQWIERLLSFTRLDRTRFGLKIELVGVTFISKLHWREIPLLHQGSLPLTHKTASKLAWQHSYYLKGPWGIEKQLIRSSTACFHCIGIGIDWHWSHWECRKIFTARCNTKTPRRKDLVTGTMSKLLRTVYCPAVHSV